MGKKSTKYEDTIPLATTPKDMVKKRNKLITLFSKKTQPAADADMIVIITMMSSFRSPTQQIMMLKMIRARPCTALVHTTVMFDLGMHEG